MAVAREIPVPRHEIDITSDYNLSLSALGDLGYKDPEALGVPALEQVQASLAATPNLEAWLIDRAGQGANDTLLISRTVGGKRGVGVAATILAFDPKAYDQGYVWSPLYGNADGSNNPYEGGDKGVIHDNHRDRKGNFTDIKSMWDVAVLLGDQTDTSTGKPAYAEGLVFTSKTVAEQRAALKKEQEQAAKLGITIVSAGLGHIVTDGAVQRTSGNPQRPGVAREIHYPNKRVGVFDRVPYVVRVGGRLGFDGSDVGDYWNNRGVRRLVRVPTPSLEA